MSLQSNMLNLQVFTSLLAAMQEQQKQQLRMPHQQQQPSSQQLPFNPLFMNQMLPNLRFPFPPMMPPPMPGSPMSTMLDSNGIKMTPKVNKETAAPLQEWFDSHLHNPYPTEEDMKTLKGLTGFTDTQLGDWFRNKRRNYKKTNQGNVPWQIPTTTIRKRRASSLSNHQNDSNSSPDSLSTAHSSPILEMPPTTPTTSNHQELSMPSPSAYSFLLAALSTPAMSSLTTNQISSPPEAASENSTTSDDDENVDVETVEQQKPYTFVQKEPSSNVKQEPSDSSPPEKRAKLYSVNDLIQ